MTSRNGLLATLVALLCPLLPCSAAAQETSASPPPDPTSIDRAPEILVTVDGRAAPRSGARPVGLRTMRSMAGVASTGLPRTERVRRAPSSWGQWVTDALTPDAPDPYEHFREVFEKRVHAPGSPFARSVTRKAAGALPSGEGSDLDLPEFLPVRLREDILRTEERIQEIRTLLFGQRGIFRLGRDQESGHSRFRLNLQYAPEPGLRFVLLTR